MAWIRLDDDYINHPKFRLLSDVAFRLWHEGMCFCQKLMTDGLIQHDELKVFRYATKKAVKELTTPRGGAQPLWVIDPAGYRVHDYLDWNLSQQEAQQERDGAKLRQRAYRSKWRKPESNALSNGESNGESNALSNADVRGRGHVVKSSFDRTEKESERKPTTARSRRPIFDGQKLVVFEWMLDESMKILGNHTEAFDLHAWFFTLDARMLAENILQPKQDHGNWFFGEVVQEAKRRGLALTIPGQKTAQELASVAWVCHHEPRCPHRVACEVVSARAPG